MLEGELIVRLRGIACFADLYDSESREEYFKQVRDEAKKEFWKAWDDSIIESDAIQDIITKWFGEQP